MKRFISGVMAFSISWLLGGCASDPFDRTELPEYIMFGHFYGECLGEGCIEIFLLTETRIMEDKNDNYPSTSPYEGDFMLLGNNQFQKARHLLEEIPLQLLEEDETRYGSPDAGDWGGIYFEYKQSGVRRVWLIDMSSSNLPEYLIPFKNEIRDTIIEINN